MPTYEYACTSCGNEWETEQSIKADALKDCPRCNQATAKRQISRGTGFILKGSGWYSDLYSGSSNKKSEGSSSPSTEAAAPSTSTSTESTTKSDSSSSSTSSDSSSSSSSGTGTGSGSTGSSGTSAA